MQIIFWKAFCGLELSTLILSTSEQLEAVSSMIKENDFWLEKFNLIYGVTEKFFYSWQSVE